MWDGRQTNDKRTREDRATQPNGCWMAEFRNFCEYVGSSAGENRFPAKGKVRIG